MGRKEHDEKLRGAEGKVSVRAHSALGNKVIDSMMNGKPGM